MCQHKGVTIILCSTEDYKKGPEAQWTHCRQSKVQIFLFTTNYYCPGFMSFRLV